MNDMIIVIPNNISFSDLDLKLVNGKLSFNTKILECISKSSTHSFHNLLKGSNEAIHGLICSWYAAHLKIGGLPNTVADALLAQ